LWAAFLRHPTLLHLHEHRHTRKTIDYEAPITAHLSLRAVTSERAFAESLVDATRTAGVYRTVLGESRGGEHCSGAFQPLPAYLGQAFVSGRAVQVVRPVQFRGGVLVSAFVKKAPTDLVTDQRLRRQLARCGLAETAPRRAPRWGIPQGGLSSPPGPLQPREGCEVDLPDLRLMTGGSAHFRNHPSSLVASSEPSQAKDSTLTPNRPRGTLDTCLADC
jgi:hypothetical protein